MTKTERFAEQYRLKVTRDECNDQIIQGRRGHLYFDGFELCLMVLDGKPAIRSKWEALGGRLWMGDKTEGVQDVKITGIPLENARPAIRMCRIRQKRILKPEEQALRRASMAKAREGLSKRPSLAVESARRGLSRGILPLTQRNDSSGCSAWVDSQTSARTLATIPCGGLQCITEPLVVVRWGDSLNGTI